MTHETVWDVIVPDCTGIYRLLGNYDCPVSPHELTGTLPSETYYYFPPLLSFGDYDSSTEIERSNLRVFERRFEGSTGWQSRKYQYNASAICIDLSCRHKAIIETLEALIDHPILDEQDCAAMELEMEQEAWTSYFEQTFVKAIERKFGAIGSKPQEGAALELYSRLKEETNTEVLILAGGEIYVDLERLIAQLKQPPASIELQW